MSASDRLRLDGCVAIATGATSGFGRTTVTALAEAGASVVITASRRSRRRGARLGKASSWL
jgi:NAD(P)-dependent dehydrogenase (short-subunit alcohol dehydrogenase family)